MPEWPLELEVTLELGSGKRATFNGAKLRAAEQLRGEVTTLVFTPDRLVVVKGGPAARRAYFDRVLGRLAPNRAGLSAEYGAAVGQRNAALRRVAQGVSSREALAPWNEQVSLLAAELVAGRHETVAALQPGFAERADELGLPRAELRYEGEAPSVEELERRLDRDLERGATGVGPHLDDLGVLSAGRDLRAFGSQGEQRLAVLALLLGEAELLEERRGTRPLLLLDDVLSELDPDRRRILADRVRASGQALVTSASRSALPGRAGPDARGLPARRRHERGHVMERIGGAVKRELSRLRQRRRDDRARGRVAGRGRRDRGCERLAGAARAGRHVARERRLLDLGLRAAAARERDRGPSARGGPGGRAGPPALRRRALAGAPRARAGGRAQASAGADARAGSRGARAGPRRSTQKISANR